MSAKTIKSSAELGHKIRLRRNELGLTIEEAASKAGVGTKTWSRYETGESIRHDKVLSVCKALKWNTFPSQEETDQLEIDLSQYRRSKVWPQALADTFGDAVAISFVIGSDIFLDNIEQDLAALSHKPKGTHIGELELSWLEDSLPVQFLMQYDYDFLCYLRAAVIHYQKQAASGKQFIAYTVVDELTLYLIMEESKFLMEGIIPYMQRKEGELKDDCCYSDWANWPFELFDDMDIVTFLYSDYYLEKNHPYHFEHWREAQFYCE